MGTLSTRPIAMPGPAKACAPRLPSLEERSPRRRALRLASAEAITAWARRGGVSITELAEVWGDVAIDRIDG